MQKTPLQKWWDKHPKYRNLFSTVLVIAICLNILMMLANAIAHHAPDAIFNGICAFVCWWGIPSVPDEEIDGEDDSGSYY